MIEFLNRATNRAKDVLFLPVFEEYWLSKLRGKVLVLVYHRVDEQGRFPFLDLGGSPVISPDELHSDLSFLKDQGAIFLTPQDLRNGVFPSPDEVGIVVSFDDGFRCAYEKGGKVLNELDIRAVFFQSTAMIDGEKFLPEHALNHYVKEKGEDIFKGKILEFLASLGEGTPSIQNNSATQLVLEKLSYPLFDQFLMQEEAYGASKELLEKLYPSSQLILEMADAGHEIGSHGHLHLHRDTLDEQKFHQELIQSSSAIKSLIGSAPGAISFPFGRFHERDGSTLEDFFPQSFSCERKLIEPGAVTGRLGRFSWPGSAKSVLRKRRWLVTGGI